MWEVFKKAADLNKKGWRPKLRPHIPAMRAQIAQTLGRVLDQVNVKAKTSEKMGPVGLGQAMEARAVVLQFKTMLPSIQASR